MKPPSRAGPTVELDTRLVKLAGVYVASLMLACAVFFSGMLVCAGMEGLAVAVGVSTLALLAITGGIYSWHRIRRRRGKPVAGLVLAFVVLGPAGVDAAELNHPPPPPAHVASDVCSLPVNDEISPGLDPLAASVDVLCLLSAIGVGLSSLACVAAIGAIIVAVATGGFALAVAIVAAIAACGTAALAMVTAVYTCTGYLCLPTPLHGGPGIVCWDLGPQAP